MSKTVGIIGGGSAGLMAAAFLKYSGDVRFTVLEKGPSVGRKLLMTGNGRCNITNRKSPKELKAGYHEASSYVYKALSSFTSEDACAFITDILGVPLKEEDNNRMFPKSDSANTILDALVKYIGSDHIVNNFDVVDIETTDTGVTCVAEDGRQAVFDTVILACGGKSYPHTGSDGSYELATSIGHTITPLIPALVGVDVVEADREFTAAVSGVSVNADAALYYDTRKQAASSGDVLFTHRGVSGPAVRELAREIPRDINSRDGWIEIDFSPCISDEAFAAEFASEVESHPKSKLTTLGSKYVPQSVAEGLAVRAGVTDLVCGQVTKTERKAYEQEIKHLKLHIDTAPDYSNAYVTRGGVSLKEVNRDTMRSKFSERVYIIGEMLDIDGISGGYNLQACMSEAYLATKSILA